MVVAVAEVVALAVVVLGMVMDGVNVLAVVDNVLLAMLVEAVVVIIVVGVVADVVVVVMVVRVVIVVVVVDTTVLAVAAVVLVGVMVVVIVVVVVVVIVVALVLLVGEVVVGMVALPSVALVDLVALFAVVDVCSELMVSAFFILKRLDWSSNIDAGKFPMFGSTHGMSSAGTPIHCARPSHTASQLVVGNSRPRPILTSLSPS